jgi:glutathione S-transferase
MEYVYLVIVLALIEYIVLSGLVGRARAKYGIKAPACTGSPEFERTFRVQQNTLEGLVVFLPGLWIFGTFGNPSIAAGIGVIGIVGRAIYARAYIAAAEKRGPGAMICGFVNIALVIGSLFGVIRAIL